MGAYILKWQNMAAQYITMRLILDLCKNTVRRPGAWFDRRWWEQEGIELTGARKRAAEAADGK